MPFIKPRDVVLYYEYRAGHTDAPAIVFANSLGTDLRIWDAVIAALPADLTVLTMDKRGHGLSETAPLDMAALARDVADVMAAHDLRQALVCGVSVGGMIAQQLAAAHPERVAGLILCNTGHRIGNADGWNGRIAALDSEGLEGIADGIIERWFSPTFRAEKPIETAGYRTMLVRTPLDGYRRTCAAIRDTDLSEPTRSLRLPTLCIAGAEDQATPPALVEELAGLIPGARYQCFEGVGHLPCLEVPEALASLIVDMHARLV
ncbi:MAG: 3-oxoadipate enol-lactonase [Geminicoccaceae bacterium]